MNATFASHPIETPSPSTDSDTPQKEHIFDVPLDDIVVVVPPKVKVMKNIMQKKHVIASYFHAFMNLCFYGVVMQYASLALTQSGISQMIWVVLFMLLNGIDAILHIWQLMIAKNMSVVDTSVKIHGLRVAMIVTKAPSEPWEVVKTTLEAMLTQDIDYPYKVWLADEDPSLVTMDWCLDNGVRISCRKGVEGYHNIDWPRRRKCKEGNLSYFYDKWGYDNYDVVFQFDSDHAPSSSYLKNSLPAFMDSDVSYIAMPNINKNGSWLSNARQAQDAWNSGPSQMSYSYSYMPMMTGSHYAVRTSALKEIGGVGPELDEDMNTTIMMNARGKTGVYAGNAIAYGDGPLCLEDMQKQELQWAKSATISFFRWRHVLLPKENSMMSSGSMIRFMVLRSWYAIQFLFFMYLWIVIAPIIFVGSWCTDDKCALSFTGLLVHSTPLLFANWGYEKMARKYDWLRPAGTPFFSVDLLVYRFLRPIWNTIGIIAGIIEMLFNVVPSFSVTRKGVSETLPLGVFTMWYVLIIPVYYAIFVAIRLFNGSTITSMSVIMFIVISCIYTYIVVRHFVDQKFRALSTWNYVGHAVIIVSLLGSVAAICVVFSDRIFVQSNIDVFIPVFMYKYDFWLTIAANASALIWMFALFLV